uniref:hypothetical protein n=1 Tax=Magnusiomyces suaveolens TaxID=44074 RepID=UPI001BEFAF2E
QMWPIWDFSPNMYFAMCEKFCKYMTVMTITMFVSRNTADLVRMLALMKNNSQVTNGTTSHTKITKREKSDLVGTPETMRKTSSKDEAFNQWLAGLIDGDGFTGVSKQGYTSCEMTVALADEKALTQMKQRFGGSVKLRSGVKAVRYRTNHRKGMIETTKAINGKIRNTKRTPQLHKVCNVTNIEVLHPQPLNRESNWFMGFFDADGSITYSTKKGMPQTTVDVTNKELVDVECFIPHFQGNFYFDKSQNGYYKWSVQDETDLTRFYEYAKLCPSRTTKFKKTMTMPTFTETKKNKGYRAPTGSALSKAWTKFQEKWVSS